MTLAAADAALRERALEIHRRAIVGDLHSHALLGAGYLGLDLAPARPRLASWNPLRNFVDLVDIPRAEEGGLGLVVFVAYVLPSLVRGYPALTERMIGRLRAVIAQYPSRIELATTASEVESIRARGRIAAMLAVEGGHALGGDLANLARLRAEGCVYLTLTHFVNNALSGSATDPRRLGLTSLGREAIAEMNRLGILVDVTHCSLAAKLEAAELSRAPVIYSHTGLRRSAGAERMTTDDELRLVARKGGLVGLLLSPYFLTGRRDAGIADVIDNLEHVIGVVGPDHAAIGSDFDSGLPPPTGLRDIRDYPEITLEMVRRGFAEDVIRKIWSQNFLRVLRAAGR